MTGKLIYSVVMLLGWPFACLFILAYGTVCVLANVVKIWMD